MFCPRLRLPRFGQMLNSCKQPGRHQMRLERFMEGGLKLAYMTLQLGLKAPLTTCSPEVFMGDLASNPFIIPSCFFLFLQYSFSLSIFSFPFHSRNIFSLSFSLVFFLKRATKKHENSQVAYLPSDQAWNKKKKRTTFLFSCF